MSHNPNPYYNNNQSGGYNSPGQPGSYNQNSGHNQPGPYNQNIIIANQKSIAIAYVLWFFLGWLGAHKFYLGQTTQGISYLILTGLFWTTSLFGIGFLFGLLLCIALLIDLFTIPGRVDRVNRGYISNTLNLLD